MSNILDKLEKNNETSNLEEALKEESSNKKSDKPKKLMLPIQLTKSMILT